jgi:streptogramin lyase
VPRYAIEDEAGTIWYADDARDFHFQEKNAACNSFNVNSPYAINNYQLDVANGKVWVAAGGVDLTFSATFRKEGFYELSDGQWSFYNQSNRPELACPECYPQGITDIIDIKTDPNTGKVYAAAYLDALICYDPATDEMKIFNEKNSTLDFAQQDIQRTRVTGLAFDAQGNLWMCNHLAPKPLAVMLANGEWHSFELPCTADDLMQRVVVDALGYKWMYSSANSTGIVVFDEGEDINSTADDRCVVLNSSNSVLPTNEVTSMEIDLDGSIWVGTKLGAAVFQCDPFSGECPGSRPFVTVDGFGANLLEDIEVKAIAVDGANRKWFGTGAGIFVMSPEGNEQIAHFTAENSPLFDNAINDIDFNDETGEAYIGTVKGLISYRAEATAAPGYHTGPLVFPNPVQEDYHGPIAIKGLAENSTVKITDISGQLVYETEALGGQAIWDGNDYKGRRADTGVYLVYATNRNSNDPQVAVAKILLMK